MSTDQRGNGDNAKERLGCSYVWVPIDLVEALLHHGGIHSQLPPNSKAGAGGTGSRKRSRAGDVAWGWARAFIVSTASTPGWDNESSPSKQSSPFGDVRLRKGRESASPGKALMSPSNKLSKRHSGPVTITIDDNEFAPDHLQNRTVTISSENADQILVSNSWWQQRSTEKGADGRMIETLTAPDDLTSLTHLHEPAVVYCLQKRYQHRAIYTYTGKILLALNPFKSCPDLYGPHIMQRYWSRLSNQGGDDQSGRAPPHIYAVAQDAYTNMMRGMNEPTTSAATNAERNQSVLVSGESGAGKTVTTKIIMRYLTTLSRQHLGNDSSSPRANADENNSIEAQVLQSNPILESFGNARTVRNDNSSRFGKFIEIRFLPSGCLVSASIETYLLEKVRLISQAPGERNYHIFYELLQGLPSRERSTLYLDGSPRDFAMTSASGTFDRRDGIKDHTTFQDLRQALDTVGFSKREQMDMFTVASTMLHCSNLTFREEAADASALDPSNRSLHAALQLLGVSFEALEGALCRSAIEARGETLYKNLSVPKAVKALEAFMKATYSAMFSHIVYRVNQSIRVPETNNSRENAHELHEVNLSAFIGVLDIFGFESFDVNSFEQLCINFCNEALQQQFNKYVFKLEQEEYEREGIEWSFISFPDNQDVLDLIEKKRTGILSILDEQCLFPRSTDETFARAVYEKCSDHPRFEVSSSQRINSAFSIQHYAGRVAYDSTNFLEKNKDELPKETTDLLMSSSNDFVAHLGEILRDPPSRSSSPVTAGYGATAKKDSRRTGSSLIRESVGSQFSTQLRELRNRITDTTPHYVRCLKPNDLLVAHTFHPLVIADQLRCAGVLEAIRVSRVGFPQRFTHDDFGRRYSLLTPKDLQRRHRHNKSGDLREVIVDYVAGEVAAHLNKQGSTNPKVSPQYRPSMRKQPAELAAVGIQMGLTKVFLRRQAFDTLELLRQRKMERAAIAIQSIVRRRSAMMLLEVSRWAVLVLQNFVRRMFAVRLATNLRRARASTRIQAHWRRYFDENRFFALLFVVDWVQRHFRGGQARDYCSNILLHIRVGVIQKHWRRFIVQGRYHQMWLSSLTVQTYYRRFCARKVLHRLKRDARDLEAVAAERDELKKETLRLKNELENTKKGMELKAAAEGSEEVEALKEEVRRLRMELKKQERDSAFQLANAEIASLAAESAAKDAELELLRRELATIRCPSDLGARSDEPAGASTWRSSSPTAHSDWQYFRSKFSSGASPQKKKLNPMESMLSPFSLFLKQTPTKDTSSRANSGRFSSNRSATSASLLDEDTMQPDVSPMTKHMMNSSGIIAGSLADDQVSAEAAFRREVNRFHLAVRHGDEEFIREMIQMCDDVQKLVNEMDQSTGETPLHMAVRSASTVSTTLLLENGAVANCQDFDGNTPLHVANNATVTEVLIEKGGANPNIPNVEGVTALHFAVQRRDLSAIQIILQAGADVGMADDTKWFSPMHVISHPYPQIGYIDAPRPAEITVAPRSQILRLLCDASDPLAAETNAGDWEGNTPLHHAVTLTEDEACDVVSTLLDKGGDPNAVNNRGQTPLHLLCHNETLRQFGVYQEMLHNMLHHGASPSQPSNTGCTALHLVLYHRDIDGAVQLLNAGASLNDPWKKPTVWQAFWNDMGSSEVFPLDMVQEEHDLHRILAAISTCQEMASNRGWCMRCRSTLGTFAGSRHCRHCGSLCCSSCARKKLAPDCFPKFARVERSSWACLVCEKILAGRREDDTSTTHPATSISEDEEERLF